MKVLLINPPQAQLRQPHAYFPLGLGYLGAVLKESNVEVEGLNLADQDLRSVSFPDADYYGISCVDATVDSVRQLTKVLKVKGKVVVGGPYPSVSPNEAYETLKPNVVIAGEAEYLFRNLVSGKAKPLPVMDAGFIKNLDALPFPDRSLFRSSVVDVSGIHGCGKGVKATTIVSSRGCPFQCRFCCRNHPMFRVHRFRSAENVAEEISFLIHHHGISHLRFVDDCFTLNKLRTLKLCGEIKKYDITWVCITRSDKVDKELLEAMQDAHCTEVHIGVETGSNRLLKIMNKQETTNTYLKAIKMIKDSGIKVKTYLIYGLPTETQADRESTLKFLKKAKPDKFTLSHFAPLSGSGFSCNPHKQNTWFYPDNDRGWQVFKARIQEAIS